MEAQDPLVSALTRLCDREGGWKAVASKLGTNDQTLYQITTGKKLPSGNPRGVGPMLRGLLDDHFPGWRDLPSSSFGKQHNPATAGSAQESAPDNSPFAKPMQPAPIARVIADLAHHMRGLDPPLRSAVGALVQGMCTNPDTAAVTAHTIHAMLAIQGNTEAPKSTNSQAA